MRRGAKIEWQEARAGVRAMVNYGTPIPTETVDLVRRVGVALKGRLLAAPGSGIANPNVALRRALGLYAQVRPVKSLPQSRYPDLDLVIVRETSEGEYAGLEHRVVPGVVESIKVVTAAACRGSPSSPSPTRSGTDGRRSPPSTRRTS